MSATRLLAGSLDALFRVRDRSAGQAAKATGLAEAVISKFRTGKRWPNAQHWDELATFFRVPPYVLLKPEDALALSDTRHSDGVDRHTFVLPVPMDAVESVAAPSYRGGMGMSDDREFAALMALWPQISQADRFALIGHAAVLAHGQPSLTRVKNE